MPFTSDGLMIMVSLKEIKNDSFNAGKRTYINCNDHEVIFTANPDIPIENFTISSKGNFSFDYFDKHYEHYSKNCSKVILGGVVTFDDN